jgi:DNA-binding SARP family transcriptional activator/Flp pilus assembly protein TadD
MRNELNAGLLPSLQALGALVLRRGPDTLASGSKPLVLLAWLACQDRRPHGRARLAALLWDRRDERRGRQSLRQALLVLRRLLGDDALELTGDTVLLAPACVQVDALDFADDVRAGRDEDAVARWAGDFLPGFEDAGGEEWRSWLDGERQRLRELFARASARRVHAARSRAEWAGAVEAARRWCDAVPLDATGHVQLLECLRLAGRTADAAEAGSVLLARWRALELEPPPELALAAAAASGLGAAAAGTVSGRAMLDAARLTSSVALFSPELVGRTGEVAELAAAWRAALAGRGTGVLVEGPVGSGRTRVVEELARLASHAGAPQGAVSQGAAPHASASQGAAPLLLRASCYEEERAVPWGTLRDLLEPLAGARGLSGAPDRELAVLAAYSPRLRERYPRLPEPPPEPSPGPHPDADAADVARALVRVLGDVAEEAPVLVVVDDVGASDVESRSVLAGLLRRLPPRVLVVLTVDDGTPHLELDDLTARGLLRRVKLQPLDRGGTEAMIASMLELPAAERGWLAARIHAETGGLPMAVHGMIAALADDGLLATDADGWRVHPALRDGSLPLPDSVRAAEQRRLARITPAARLLLDAAAIPAGGATEATLRQRTQLADDDFDGALELLMTRRLVQYAGGPGDGALLQPAHPLLRRIILDEMGPARRTRLQAGVARGGDGRRRRVMARWLAAAAIVLLSLGTLRVASREAPLPADTVAVLPFTVHGAASLAYLGEGLADLLGASLEGTAGLRTVDPHALIAYAPAARTSSPSAARRLAGRFGAGTWITGSITGDGDALRVRATVHSRTARPAVIEVQVPGEYDLFAAVDELARRVLATLLDDAGTTAAPPTPSLPALRAYLDGKAAFRRGRYAEAADHFREATRHDSLFPLAHFRLALAAEFSGQVDPAVFRETVDRALRDAHQLPWRDRELLHGFEAFHFGSAAAAEARLRALVTEYPNDTDGWYMLAEVLLHAGPRVARDGALLAAREAYEQVLRLHPAHPEALLHLVRVAIAQDDAPAVRQYLERLRASSIAGSPVALATEAMHAFTPGPPRQRGRQGDARDGALGDARDGALGGARGGARDDALTAALRERPAFQVLMPALFVATFAQSPRDAAALAAFAVNGSRPPAQRAAAHAFRAVMFAAAAEPDSTRAALAAAAVLHPRRAARTTALIGAAPSAALTDAERRDALATLQRSGGEEAHSVDDLRYVTHVPGMDVAFDAYAAGLLHAQLGELDAAEAAADRLGVVPASDARLAADLARGVRADVRLRRARRSDGDDAARELAAALELLEAIRFETWHQAAMTSPFHTLARERFLRAEVLRELGRDDEAAAWRRTAMHSTPFDLLYRL